jgi:hypothetical protein
MICGDAPYFSRRSSYYLTQFFQDCETEYQHDGTTRRIWVSGVLSEIIAKPWNHNFPHKAFLSVIQNLMDKSDASPDDQDRQNALKALNAELQREGFEAYYSDNGKCYLRNISTNTLSIDNDNPHRPFTKIEIERKSRLTVYLESATEDELISEVLLPLYRHLGFYRITSAGHKDKQLEYGKDVWMKFTLPTQHVLYFGIQAKKGKLDASGASKSATSNVAEIYQQALMMLGHEIFDPEIGKRALVDHAIIVAGGEITKAARNWLGGKLDASKRSQILFMDKEDILNLYIVTNLPLPAGALPQGKQSTSEDLPF